MIVYPERLKLIMVHWVSLMSTPPLGWVRTHLTRTDKLYVLMTFD